MIDSEKLEECLISKKLVGCLKINKAKAEVINRFGDDYGEYNYQFNLREMKYPKGFIAVKSTRDVKIALKCLIKLKVKFTIKSGGHSFEKYSFGGNDYWVIDLKYLNSVKLNRITNVVTVGAGIRLGKLSETLLNFGNYGLTVGACFSVGISGYTLGGGFGLFSRQHGLMLDRAVEFEMVTADRRVLAVNSWRHSDLFWALRGGGGGNFGIVTQFKLKVFKTFSKVASILIYYDFSSFKYAFANWQRWVQSDPSDSIGSLVRFSFVRNYSRIEFIIHDYDENVMNKHINEIRQYFPEMKNSDIHISSFNETLYRISNPYFGNRTYLKEKSFYVSKILTKQEINRFVEAFMEFHVTILIEMFGGKINEIDSSETAFCHRQSLYLMQYSVNAHPSADDPDANKGEKKLHDNLENFSQRVSFMNNGECYINYIDSEETDPFKKYYCDNFERLVEVKKKYDPENIFRFPLSIPTEVCI